MSNYGDSGRLGISPSKRGEKLYPERKWFEESKKSRSEKSRQSSATAREPKHVSPKEGGRWKDESLGLSLPYESGPQWYPPESSATARTPKLEIAKEAGGRRDAPLRSRPARGVDSQGRGGFTSTHLDPNTARHGYGRSYGGTTIDGKSKRSSESESTLTGSYEDHPRPSNPSPVPTDYSTQQFTDSWPSRDPWVPWKPDDFEYALRDDDD